MSTTYRRPAITTINRAEFIGDINLNLDSNNQLKSGQYYLPTDGGLMPSERFMSGILLQFEGRFTNPSTGQPTGTLADAPFSLIDTIQLNGYHRIRGQNEPFINVRGSSIRELVLEQKGRAPYVTGTLSTTASAAVDVRFIIPVPFVPLGIPLAQQIDWLLDCPNYNNLKLALTIGDATSIYSGQTGYIVASAYGSNSGTPRVRVTGLFAQAGQSQFQGFVPARLWRYNNGIFNATAMTTSTTNARLASIPTGNRLRGILVKTGVLGSPDNSLTSFSSLSDTILANIKVNRGLNKQVLYFADAYAAKEKSGDAYHITPSQGYLPIDWCDNRTLGTAFDATQLTAGPTGDVDFYLQGDTTGAASQALEAMWEELRGEPMTQ